MPPARPAPRKPKAVAAEPGAVHVPFRVRLDGARDVALAADFNGWSAEAGRLTRQRDGAWTIDLLLAPGEYQYRLVVDGEWRDHLEAPRRVCNGLGTQNCVLEVSTPKS